jgi:hypothetical protein
LLCKGQVTQRGNSNLRAKSPGPKVLQTIRKTRRKKMLSKILRGAVLATIAVGATVAQANPFAEPATSSKSGTLIGTGYSNGWVSVNVGNPAYNGQGGQFQGTFNPDGNSGPNATDDFFRFFCVQLGEYYSFNNTYTYTRVLQGDSADNTALKYLYDQNYPNKSMGNFLGGSPYGSFANATTSGAMQLAIWNIIYDTDWTLNSGTFQATDSAAKSAANTMLTNVKAAIDSNALLSGEWTLYRFENVGNPGHQDFLSATYASGDRFLPLPGTLALFGIGLAGLGLARRKS